MTSFEAFEVQSHASQGCSTVELLEEITANSNLCVHIERELLKVCETHVSLPDLPTHPPLSDACPGVSYRTFLTGEFQGLPKDQHVQAEGTCMHRHRGR